MKTVYDPYTDTYSRVSEVVWDKGGWQNMIGTTYYYRWASVGEVRLKAMYDALQPHEWSYVDVYLSKRGYRTVFMSVPLKVTCSGEDHRAELEQAIEERINEWREDHVSHTIERLHFSQY